MTMLKIGDVTITTVVETDGPTFDPAVLLPDWTDDVFKENRDWLVPDHFDPVSGFLIMPIQSFVVKTAHQTILVDGCFGNHKERANPRFTMLATPWLDRLAALGASPSDIDIVMCTHLHPDHVGWNTQLEDGRWVPTFRNASYLFNEVEWAHWEAENNAADEPLAHLVDSVLPVIAAGQSQLVSSHHRIDDNIVMVPLPGHTPGHVGMEIGVGDETAILTGDMIHHPIQLAFPDWNSGFCSDQVTARATRRAFLERTAESNILVAPAHFAAPTFGRVKSHGEAFRFQFHAV